MLFIGFKAEPPDWELWRNSAKEQGMTLSEYIRKHLPKQTRNFEKLKEEKNW